MDFSELSIRDVSGKIVFRTAEGRAGEILNPPLPPGMYFLHWLEDGRKPVVQKLIQE